MKNFISRLDKLKFVDGKGIPGITLKWVHFIAYLQLRYLKKTHFKKLNGNNKPENIIVSLTTFPKRNYAVTLAIKSLLNQTLQPDKIVVWLAKDQYPELPESFRKLKKYGIDFNFVEDIKSHKKYFYALQTFSEDLVITVDDDLIYPEELIEQLYRKHLEYPKSIVCFRGRTIPLDSEGNIESYSHWYINTNDGVDTPSLFVMPSTGAGTLYPPGTYDNELFNLEAIEKLAKYADDIWVRFMTIRIGTKVIKTHNNCRYLSSIPISGDKKLSDYNVDMAGNDSAIKSILKAYPDVLEKLRQDRDCSFYPNEKEIVK